jgi:hypothetical protein
MKSREQHINHWKKVLKDHNWPNIHFGFQCCRWGSCQYIPLNGIFDLYFSMRETLGVPDILNLLGITMILGKAFKESDIFDRNMFGSYIREEYIKSDVYSKEEIEHFISLANCCQSFDDMFLFHRHCAGDLWSAIPEVARFAFGKYKIKMPKSPEKGWKYQFENFKLGILAALLVDNGYVKNERSFYNFDT